MKHLFNRVYMKSIIHLSDGINRIVVGRNIENYFVDDLNSLAVKSLGIKGLPGTLYHTRRVDYFVFEKFPEMLPELLKSKERITIYCDEETYVKLYAYWSFHIFKGLTQDQYNELVYIDVLDRLGGDVGFRVEHPTYQATYLRNVYHSLKINDNVITELRNNVSALSLEYRILGVLNGDNPASTATTIRKILADSVDGVLSDLRQAVCLMFYTKRLNRILDISPVKTPMGVSPLNRVKGLNRILEAFTIEDKMKEYENPDDLISELREDYKKIGTVALEVDMAKVDHDYDAYYLIFNKDDQEVVKKYGEYLIDGLSPMQFIPSDVVGGLSLNLITWLILSHHSGTAPTLSWT